MEEKKRKMEEKKRYMEEMFDDELSVLLTCKQGFWGYTDFDTAVRLPRKNIKLDGPFIPNKLPLLPSGEIAKLTTPSEVAIPGVPNIEAQGKKTEDDLKVPEDSDDSELSESSDDLELSGCSGDSELSDAEEIIYEEANGSPTIYLDSCGREVDYPMNPMLTSCEEITDDDEYPSLPSFQREFVEPDDSSDEDITQPSTSREKISSFINMRRDLSGRKEDQNGTAKTAQSIIANFYSFPKKDRSTDAEAKNVANFNYPPICNGTTNRQIETTSDQCRTSPLKRPQAKNNSSSPKTKVPKFSCIKKECLYGVDKLAFYKPQIDQPEMLSDDENIDAPFKKDDGLQGPRAHPGLPKIGFRPVNEPSDDSSSDEGENPKSRSFGSSDEDENEDHEDFTLDEENNIYPCSCSADKFYVRQNDYNLILKGRGKYVVMFINITGFRKKGFFVDIIDEEIIKIQGFKGSKKKKLYYRAPNYADIVHVKGHTIIETRKKGVSTYAVKIVCPKKCVVDDWQCNFYTGLPFQFK